MSIIDSAIVLICCASMSAKINPEVARLFEARSWKHPTTGVSYTYRWFAPDFSGDGPGSYPLIVWLHAFGENGDDNLDQLQWLDRCIFTSPRVKDRFPFYCLAVQCPTRDPGWFVIPPPWEDRREDMLDITFRIIEENLRERPIDPDRILLAGISSGGTACWEFATRHPDMFAGVVIAAGAGSRRDDVTPLTSVPVWVFHGVQDSVFSILGVRESVARLADSGGNVRLTELVGQGHECWISAFGEYSAHEWLVSQRRGNHARAGLFPWRVAVRRVMARWRWWQLVIEVMLASFVGIFMVRLYRMLEGKVFWWRHGRRSAGNALSGESVEDYLLGYRYPLKALFIVSVLLLVVQCFPSMARALFSILDVRGWHLWSYGIAAGVAGALLMGLKHFEELLGRE
ncbi:MAG: hypothetical protein U1D30_08910 [Planctomycetota bacterium]